MELLRPRILIAACTTGRSVVREGVPCSCFPLGWLLFRRAFPNSVIIVRVDGNYFYARFVILVLQKRKRDSFLPKNPRSCQPPSLPERRKCEERRAHTKREPEASLGSFFQTCCPMILRLNLLFSLPSSTTMGSSRKTP